MLSIPLLLLAIVIPGVFWIYGKRLLGNQTHPAALFILAWMASAFVLGGVEATSTRPGQLAVIWVTVNFAVFALVKKLGAKQTASPNPKEIKSDEPR
jgi:hypothetical protein